MPFAFYVEKPKDVKKTLEKLKKTIEDGGGCLKGDETRGVISMNAVEGQYIVGADAVEITILKKPALYPASAVKKNITDGFRRFNTG